MTKKHIATITVLIICALTCPAMEVLRNISYQEAELTDSTLMEFLDDVIFPIVDKCGYDFKKSSIIIDYSSYDDVDYIDVDIWFRDYITELAPSQYLCEYNGHYILINSKTPQRQFRLKNRIKNVERYYTDLLYIINDNYEFWRFKLVDNELVFCYTSAFHDGSRFASEPLQQFLPRNLRVREITSDFFVPPTKLVFVQKTPPSYISFNYQDEKSKLFKVKR